MSFFVWWQRWFSLIHWMEWVYPSFSEPCGKVGYWPKSRAAARRTLPEGDADSFPDGRTDASSIRHSDSIAIPLGIHENSMRDWWGTHDSLRPPDVLRFGMPSMFWEQASMRGFASPFEDWLHRFLEEPANVCLGVGYCYCMCLHFLVPLIHLLHMVFHFIVFGWECNYSYALWQVMYPINSCKLEVRQGPISNPLARSICSNLWRNLV